jgi:hypothetical protein
VVFTSASLLGLAAAAEARLCATVLGQAGLPDGLAPLDGLPELGVAEMAVFGDAAGRTQLVEPLVRCIREGLGKGRRPLAA